MDTLNKAKIVERALRDAIFSLEPDDGRINWDKCSAAIDRASSLLDSVLCIVDDCESIAQFDISNNVGIHQKVCALHLADYAISGCFVWPL